MEPATFTFSALALLAKESGLAGFLQDQSQKVIERLIHKKIQDKAVASKYLRKFFTPEIETAFQNAFAEIAPSNKQIRRRFLLTFLTDPTTSAAITNIQSGKPPTTRELYGVLEKLRFPEKDIPALAEQLVVRLYSELSKVPNLANQVTLTLPAKLARIEQKIDDLKDIVAPAEKVSDFLVPELPANFVGRESLLAALSERLVSRSGVAPLTNTQTVGIYGMAGIGKTYLALRFAHEQNQLNHFDGIYYQFCGDNSVAVVAEELAEKLGLEVSGLPPDKLLRVLNNELSQRRTLLLLDDVRDPAISELLPGGRASTIITTRRKDLPFLAQYAPLNVADFTKLECLQLFRKMMGEKLDGHEEQAARISAALGQLPIAVSVAAGLLRDDVRWTFDRLLDLLEHKQQARVDVLEHRQRNVARLFNTAFDRLSAEEETLLCAMGACAEEGFRFVLAAEVAGMTDSKGLPEESAYTALQILIDRSLVRELDRGEQRYFLHTLIRQSVRKRSQFAELPDKHLKIVSTLFENWEKNWRICLNDLGEAREAFQYATANKFSTEAISLSYRAYLLCSRTGRLQEALAFTKAFEELAVRFENKDSLQASYGNQALILKDWGRLEEAMQLHKKQEEICIELGNKNNLQISYGNQAIILQAWGRLEEAMQLHKKEEEICIELGNKDSLQRSYGNQAIILQAWGRLEEAMQLHKKKEEVCIELGRKSSLGYCYWGMASVHVEKGEKNNAIKCGKQALALFAELNMPQQTEALEEFLNGLD